MGYMTGTTRPPPTTIPPGWGDREIQYRGLTNSGRVATVRVVYIGGMGASPVGVFGGIIGDLVVLVGGWSEVCGGRVVPKLRVVRVGSIRWVG